VSALQALAIFAAGIAAGTINSVVGSGTLITFPILLAFGYQPVLANVSNSLGLAPGALAGAYGYRRELTGQGRRAAWLTLCSALGASIGAVLLLALPPKAFKDIVPVFIALALILVIAQPLLARRLAARGRSEHPRGSPWTRVGVFGSGIYGGYFGAAQGVLLLGILGLGLDEPLQRVNAVKNLLAGTANGVAGIIFVFAARVDWRIVGLLAAGSILGGVCGARYGRRMPATALRALILTVGVVAIARLI
jgi:uncharacterized membrane protein YfcA